MKKIIYWVLLATVSLLLVGSFILFKQKGNNYTEFFQVLSGFATFIVAILTGAYVFTTNNQLSIMEKQLDEMSKGRELENQPFPWIENPIFKIEKPRAFYSPPRNSATIHSLYEINYKIKNIGKGVAVGVFIDPKFTVEFGSEKYENDGVPIKIEVIEEGKYFEYKKPWYDNCNRVSINTDNNHLALKSLAKGRVDSFPKLHMIIYYRNFIGAAFRINCTYKVMKTLDPGKPNDDFTILKGWLSKLTDVNIKFSTKLKQVEATYRIDKEEGRKKFKAIKNYFNGMMEDPSPEALGFPIVLISDKYELTTITKEEYGLKIKALLEDDERRRYN